MRLFLSILLSLTSCWAQAQDDEVLRDEIHQDYIASVKFHAPGAPLTQPIVNLDGGRLSLSFDDLDADVKYYYYTIIHCDKDWKPSADINEMDYIDGFTEEEMDNYDFSSRTLQPFTHYDLTLPNADMSWKISGNYVLRIFLDEGGEEAVLTRRFIVVDTKVIIDAEVSRAFDSGKMQSHQEVDFVVTHKGFPIANPKQEVSVSVIQNGMWTTMKENIKPLFVKGERLEYDYQGQILFQGLREFRVLDLRSFRFRTEQVAGVRRHDDGVDIDVVNLPIRRELPYIYQIDINGNFIIESLDEENASLEGDYALVNFFLPKPFPIDGGDVYVVGGLTDWQLQERYRMEYDEAERGYSSQAFLKQGVYNYLLAYVPEEGGEMDFDELEGNKQETENDYTIIVYYRPFGGRYDQVIAVRTIDSIGL